MVSGGAYDVLVLGAGVSGLTAAATLARRGCRVCLLDDYPEPGGNHLSWSIGDCTFDLGAIFFWPDNPLFAVFPALRTLCLPVDYAVAKVAPDGRVMRYPFDASQELFARSPRYLARVTGQILAQRLWPVPKAGTAQDFIRYYLGEALGNDTGLGHYFRRFYGLPPQAVSGTFARSRMRWVAERAGLRTGLARLVRRPGAAVAAPLQAMVRPREGFARFYRAALDQLAAEGVQIRLGAGLEAASVEGGRFRVRSAAGTLDGARLISTIPLARARSLFGLDPDAAPPSKTLTSLFCRFRGDRGFGAIVLYNFHPDGAWKRVTMHSDAYGLAGGWQYFSVEIVGDGTASDIPALFDDFRASTHRVGLFSGEMHLEGSAATGFAYPVYGLDVATQREASSLPLLALGVELAGRQGRFEYMASSKVAVEAVLDALHHAQFFGKVA